MNMSCKWELKSSGNTRRHLLRDLLEDRGIADRFTSRWRTPAASPIVTPWPLKVAIWMLFFHKEVTVAAGLTWPLLSWASRALDGKSGIGCVLAEPGEGVCWGTVSNIATLHQLGCALYWHSSTQHLDRDDPSVQELLQMSPTDEDSMLG